MNPCRNKTRSRSKNIMHSYIRHTRTILARNDTFATRLRDLIEKRGTTIKAVAECIGITRQSVSQYCEGATQPNADTIAKIATYFNVSADYLLGLIKTPTIHKATSIYVLEFTFVGEVASENPSEAAQRFAEYLREHTIADDVQVLSSKIFLHDAPER